MTDRDLIQSIGREEIAAALRQEFDRISAEAVRKWETRGIPHKYRFAVHRLARQKRRRVPRNFLEDRRPAA